MSDRGATMSEQELRELELACFVANVRDDPPEIVARKVWLHSRWYADEEFATILDAARAVNAVMTFCFLARDVPLRRGIIQRMVDEGHEIATHGRRHYRIDEQLDCEQLLGDLRLCVDQLGELGIHPRGLWTSTEGRLTRDTGQALLDAGLTWFASGKDHDSSRLPQGLRFVPVLKPNDFELLLLHPTPIAQVAETWRQMAESTSDGVLLFHPFSLTMSDSQALPAWTEFLSNTGGAVPVRDWPAADGRPAILIDASLRLHVM